MRASSISALGLLMFSLATGCASQDASSGPSSTAGGGKADGSDASGLVAISDAEEAELRAFDAECWHQTMIETGTATTDGYLQAIRLMCMPRGGDVAPEVYFVGVLPVGEVGGARKIYLLQQHFSSVPDKVKFTTVGAKTTLTFESSAAVFTNDADFENRAYTISVALSGSSEAPHVTTSTRFTIIPSTP